MLNTQWQKDMAKGRREARKMEAAGYIIAELDWRLLRGSLARERIEDVKVSADGHHVWYRISNGPHPWTRS